MSNERFAVGLWQRVVRRRVANVSARRHIHKDTSIQQTQGSACVNECVKKTVIKQLVSGIRVLHVQVECPTDTNSG